jgi:xanthine dehydrogenase YagS FAD-binding subunit
VGAWTVPGTAFKVELAKRTLVRQLQTVSEVAR